VIQIVEVEAEHGDQRSVDDLLSFINGEDKGIVPFIFSWFFQVRAYWNEQ